MSGMRESRRTERFRERNCCRGTWMCIRPTPIRCIWEKSFSRPILITPSSMWKFTMPRILMIACLLVCWSASAFAQFGSNTARRIISGTAAPPALCNAGPVDIYVRTGATSPGLYLCLTANTWTGPLSTGGAAPAGATNTIQKNGGAGAFQASSLIDNGTTVTGTEQYIGPLLTGPTYSMVGQTAQGFGDDATIWGPGAPTIWLGANARGLVVFNGITIPTTASLGWATSNINANAAIDTKLSRSAAGTVSFDTSSQANGLGALTNCRTIVNVTPVTVNANVSTDQNLMAATIPANCLSTVNRTVRIWVAGVYSTPAASTSAIRIKVLLCSVSGCASGNIATLINIVSTAIGTLQVTNNAFNLTAWSTTQTLGAASRSEAHGVFSIDLGATTATADSVFNDVNTATIAGSPSDIDFTAQNFLQVTIAASVASGSNSFTERQLILDSVN